MAQQNEIFTQNILDEHARSLASGESNRTALLAQHNLDADSEIAQLMILAEQLCQNMSQQKPSKEFVQTLYCELVGIEQSGVLTRIRHLDFQGINLSQLQLERLRQLNMDAIPQQIDRLRNVSRRVQLAAGLTITAGVFLIAARPSREILLGLLPSGEQGDVATSIASEEMLA